MENENQYDNGYENQYDSNQYDEDQYDNDQLEAIRRDKERRRKTARLRQQRKRELQMKKRRAIIFVLSIVVMIAVFAIISSAVKKLDKRDKTQSEATQTNEVMATLPDENNENQQQQTTAKDITLKYPTIDKGCKNITDTDINCPYIAILDINNNSIIAGRSATSKIYPASMTKVMTLLVTMDYYDDLKDKTFTFTNEMLAPLVEENASRAGFDPGEEVGLDDLLYGLILPSGADSADAIAKLVAGSNEAFAELMNKKVQALGLKNTHFANPSGLYDEKQYTTPVEMSMIMAYTMTNPMAAKILSTYQYTTAKTSYHPDGILLTSTMFSRMYGTEAEGVIISAGKTGYVIESGNCLVCYATKQDKPYVCVLSGATYKWHPIFDSFYTFERYLP